MSKQVLAEADHQRRFQAPFCVLALLAAEMQRREDEDGLYTLQKAFDSILKLAEEHVRPYRIN